KSFFSQQLLTLDTPSLSPQEDQIIVEHTNINPNKAAHIGHLRNAVLGDTLVRVLRGLGHRVEVQNYIDDTGVQVADVVVALTEMERLSEDQISRLLAVGAERLAAAGHGVDHDLWDLYAKVTTWYEYDASRLAHRGRVLHALERREGPLAELGARLAAEVVRCHLSTMQRLGVHYELLPKESDILAHRFWDTAFARLRESGAIRLVDEGKAAGCWVMNLPHDEQADDSLQYEKIIVRSDATVTYVGKDIAYQLWKFGLLAADFEYRPLTGFAYESAEPVWETARPGEGSSPTPAFGRGECVYNVIDVRQSYLQRVVRQSLELLGHTAQAERSVHFSYEMVALSPQTALELQPGLELSDEERSRPWLDMSGRKGLGVKADDLIDRLATKALDEIRERNPQLDAPAQEALARQVAVGALRYYMLRFTRNKIVAFDIDAALAFEGETGPYCQYAAVRVARIVDKLHERLGWGVGEVHQRALGARFEAIPDQIAVDHWRLVHQAARLPEVARVAIESLELATLAKYAFELAQAINGFYHRFPVLQERDGALRDARLAVLLVADRSLRQALDLMGIEVPERM
ncbi:MAG: arginine--tRNA ligase, partial [Acidobacteriota bacterium]